MIRLLTKAFHPDLKQEFKFVASAIRKIATSTFLKAVCSQCTFEANHHVIGIEGLWQELCNRPTFTSNIKVKVTTIKKGVLVMP
jgi:hypothetical protein